MPAAIRFERVSFAYGDGPPILREASFAIEAGEVFAIVGRSGAGKSTALRLINRLDLPDAGDVAVDGRSTREWDPIRLRRHTGFVLQDIALFPHMTVAGNIGLLARLEGWPADRVARRVAELLALVGLPADFRDRWPHEISGGQQQRVGVARALMMDPPILLMDEPFGALDPLTRLSLQRELRRIQDTLRKTIVIVTHDLREAFSLGDRVGVLDEGVLLFNGPPSELRGSPHPFVHELLATLDVADLSSPRRTSPPAATSSADTPSAAAPTAPTSPASTSPASRTPSGHSAS